MDEKEQAEIGAKWGEILGMKRHRDEHGTPISPIEYLRRVSQALCFT